MKPHFRLRVVKDDRPLAPLSRAEKLANAKAYLQRRGLYILERGTPRPTWGIPGDVPPTKNALHEKIMEDDRRRKK